jgi:hypothetical protein
MATTKSTFKRALAKLPSQKLMSDERKQAIEAVTEVVRFVQTVQPDLEPLDVMIAVDNFWHTMGDAAIVDLAVFIKYGRAHQMDNMEIGATVGHDLNGAGSRCFLPRSNGYAKRLEA